ncbi:MAG: glycosyl hydrolase family 2 [Muribaculaceae bacterium]|nr:glycosyl hydrolase family 2 [Muribaculaceae bacterium]
MKTRLTSLIGCLLAFAGALNAYAKAETTSSATEWYPIETENKPFVRWWWLGSAVDKEGLTFNLEEFANKGLGGVEITPIYGVKGNEINDIPYLSPEWMEMLEHTIKEGERMGLQIDMNNGTGWPFGGPQVGIENSARKRVVEKWKAAPGKMFSEKILPSDPKQREVASLQAIIAVNGDKRLDITSKLGSDSLLTWRAPKADGDWNIYAIFSGRTFQKVKRAAPGGEGFVLNHYDSVAVKSYFERFDKAFEESGAPMPDTFFNDSFEVYGSDWTDNILDEFRKHHGYSLEMYIPELTEEDSDSEIRSRVVRDFRFTLGELLRENFTDIWVAHSHGKGVRVRNQSHGSPANIIDLYAIVDIPECESFGQTIFSIPGLIQDGPSRPSDADPAVLKFASSAAHLTGKPLTSAETLTWLTEHFRTSLSRCKPELDQMFSSGVNHVYFHGAPYSPKNIEFPGWMFYASINMSPTNSIWKDADALFSYVARVQAFLSAGIPDNDFLLYFPIEEIWQTQGGNPYLMFEIHKMDQRMPFVKEAVNKIVGEGYDVDYISDLLLNNIEVENQLIKAEGGSTYRGIVVPPARFMQPETLQRILQLADNGATVIFVGSLPEDVPGLSDREERLGRLKSLSSQLPGTQGSDETIISPFGKGNIIISPDYSRGLAASEVKPETMRTEQGLILIRRRNETGGYNYFISLLKDAPVNGFVTLPNVAESVMIFDPLTGRKGLAQTQKSADGDTQVRLQLEPGESVLLKTFPYIVESEPWNYIWEKGEPILIDKGWSISFLNSEPPIEGTFTTDSLIPWTDLPHPDASVNFGTARYSVTFNLENPESADLWLLDLGELRESANVTVNGSQAGKVWSVPFTIQIGEFLKQGLNTLEIDVTNLQANRIADFERKGVEWRIFKDANIASVTNAKEFSFADWPVIPAGLNSEVKLIPLKIDK